MEKKIAEQVPPEPDLTLPMKPMKSVSFFGPKLLGILVVTILLGVGSGYLLSKGSATGGNALQAGTVNPSSLSKGAAIGSSDTKTFKDIAEGTLKTGGIKGEGQFHLVRPGGDSQSVYLTSSNLDLSKLVGKKIKVWGETQKAEHAGWLMDVGRTEILE